MSAYRLKLESAYCISPQSRGYMWHPLFDQRRVERFQVGIDRGFYLSQRLVYFSREGTGHLMRLVDGPIVTDADNRDERDEFV